MGNSLYRLLIYIEIGLTDISPNLNSKSADFPVTAVVSNTGDLQMKTKI